MSGVDRTRHKRIGVADANGGDKEVGCEEMNQTRRGIMTLVGTQSSVVILASAPILGRKQRSNFPPKSRLKARPSSPAK